MARMTLAQMTTITEQQASKIAELEALCATAAQERATAQAELAGALDKVRLLEGQLPKPKQTAHVLPSDLPAGYDALPAHEQRKILARAQFVKKFGCTPEERAASVQGDVDEPPAPRQQKRREHRSSQQRKAETPF